MRFWQLKLLKEEYRLGYTSRGTNITNTLEISSVSIATKDAKEKVIK